MGGEVRCVVAAALLPEARPERTLLVALIAFTFDGLACDRPLTQCIPAVNPQPPLAQGHPPAPEGAWAAGQRWAEQLSITCDMRWPSLHQAGRGHSIPAKMRAAATASPTLWLHLLLLGD